MSDQNDSKVPKPYPSIASLLSPPETMRQDSFGSTNNSMYATPSFESVASSGATQERPVQAALVQNPVIPISPPISPDKVEQEEKAAQVTEHDRDPQLYAASEAGESISSSMPLFPSDAASCDKASVIDRHIAARDPQMPNPPTREDYSYAVTLYSTVLERFRKDPKAYWKQEMEQWDAYRELAAAKRERERQKHKRELEKEVTKESLRKVAARTAFKKPRQPVAPRAQRAPRQTVQTSFRDPRPHFLGIPEFTLPVPKAPRPAAPRGDFIWRSLPDFSPPVSTLPDVKSALKTDWKGQPLDLSNDPDREQLHPDEARLASTLRLTCAAYLHSKRNIFKARLEKFRVGKEFRKTDAQQACSIDVNKASKLWTAFDKVGWFSPEYMRKHL